LTMGFMAKKKVADDAGVSDPAGEDSALAEMSRSKKEEKETEKAAKKAADDAAKAEKAAAAAAAKAEKKAADEEKAKQKASEKATLAAENDAKKQVALEMERKRAEEEAKRVKAEEEEEDSHEDSPTAELDMVVQQVVDEYNLGHIVNTAEVSKALSEKMGVSNGPALQLLMADDSFTPVLVETLDGVAPPTFHVLLCRTIAKRMIEIRTRTLLGLSLNSSRIWLTKEGWIKHKTSLKLGTGHEIRYYKIKNGDIRDLKYTSRFGRATLMFYEDGGKGKALEFKNVRNGPAVWKFIEKEFFGMDQFP